MSDVTMDAACDKRDGEWEFQEMSKDLPKSVGFHIEGVDNIVMRNNRAIGFEVGYLVKDSSNVEADNNTASRFIDPDSVEDKKS
ncbi:hypothetical protein [Micrococcus endophyticus]|uniref:hypothetical protein n=1 Tax=Micrococcus endophyticus TaxID=455343 RepID=UPI0020037B0C|nr:hypothetical protein [Micrococcus endophyticus]MCK6089727.1 hypothetical protein [Micrococcus endophyticus]